MELRDEIYDALGIWVVDVHGNDIDLVNAAIAGLKERTEPWAISVHEGWRDVFRVRVRGVEEGL